MIPSSKNTSVNAQRVPALFNRVQWEPYTTALDYGCGRFPSVVSRFLTRRDVVPFFFDPHNGNPIANRIALDNGPYDTVVLSNVLNVVQSLEERVRVLRHCRNLMKDGGRVLVSVYAGDRSGIGCESKPDCYQLNRKLAEYIPEVLAVFPCYRIERGVLILNLSPRGDK